MLFRNAAAIAWAQFRITRNHLPRTSAGTVVSWLVMSVWYGLYAAGALFLAIELPEVARWQLVKWLPIGLLALFLFWQIIPLFTLSSGWSLQLNKLQIYPVSNGTLFLIEVLLRVTSSPEMMILLLGLIVGLLRHPRIPVWAPWVLLLYIPLNLFCQLGIRDLILHAFERNRFRELFAVIIISVSILPQFLLRTGLGASLRPYFYSLAANRIAPWSAAAFFSTGRGAWRDVILLIIWTALSFLFARWSFGHSLTSEETFQPNTSKPSKSPSGGRVRLATWPSTVFRDPLAALMQKEMQSLVRMPKFRVVFGMACFLGMVVFIPAAANGHDQASAFMRNNLVPIVNLYGLLLLSDVLLLNAFGFDRAATQAYFVCPISLSTVFVAKNLTAVVFVILQSAVILLVANFARVPVTSFAIVSGLLASAVVTIFLLTTGNFTSLNAPRPIDARQTFRKQAGAKMQIWLFGSALILFLLIGFAYLARYAFNADWVLLAVLACEFLVGLLVYRIGLASAVKRGFEERERIVQRLSGSGSPVSLG